MRLLLPSLITVAYIFLSLVLPLHTHLWVKVLLGLVMLAISLKYLIYETFGGSFFQPDLPLDVLVPSEALYGALICLFFLAILKDITGAVLWLSRRFDSGWFLPGSPASRAVVLSLAALLCGVWGSWQAIRVPDVRTLEVRIPALPDELEGFSLIQLSDIHIGSMLKKAWLEQVVEKTNALEADAIAITGDVIDGLPHALAEEVSPLRDLKARYGVFLVPGNHEYYYDAKGWIDTFRAFGLNVLENEHRVLPGGLVLGGITDRTAHRLGGKGPEAVQAFADAPAGPRILLAHQPTSFKDASAAGIDLQLSGHTHGGLLFFLAPIIARFNDGYVNGLYHTDNGLLYVHPGTGLWSGFSCRIGIPSEITHIILRRA